MLEWSERTAMRWRGALGYIRSSCTRLFYTDADSDQPRTFLMFVYVCLGIFYACLDPFFTIAFCHLLLRCSLHAVTVSHFREVTSFIPTSGYLEHLVATPPPASKLNSLEQPSSLNQRRTTSPIPTSWYFKTLGGRIIGSPFDLKRVKCWKHMRAGCTSRMLVKNVEIRPNLCR